MGEDLVVLGNLGMSLAFAPTIQLADTVVGNTGVGLGRTFPLWEWSAAAGVRVLLD